MISNTFNFDESPVNLECLESSEYKENVLAYIAGFIQKKIVKVEHCSECIMFIRNSCKSTSKFLDLRDQGGLIKPCDFMLEIVITSDSVLSQIMEKQNILLEQHVYEKCASLVLQSLDMKKPFFLSELNSHMQHLNSIGTHRNIFIKKVIKCYVSLKLKHIAKQKTEKLHKKKVRHVYSKLVLFKNQ